MNHLTKGQGATEYLVILSIVLIVALVVVGLLGYFPGLAGGMQVSESNSYWQSAQPIAILASIGFSSGSGGSGTANITLSLQNQGTNALTITSVNITSSAFAGNTSWNATAFTMPPGSRAVVQLFNTTSFLPVCAHGQPQNYNVSFTYNDGNLAGIMEQGAKPLAVLCQ